MFAQENVASGFDQVSSFAFNRMGTVLYWLKQLDKSLYCCNKSVELNPYNARYWYTKGVVLTVLEHYDEALDCYNSSLELKTRSGNKLIILLLHKGFALLKLERYDEALDSFNEALELNPGRKLMFQTLHNKSHALLELGRYDEALDYVNKALELNTHNLTWTNKSMTLYKLERYDEALDCANKALKLNTNDPLTWSNKSMALCKLERYDEALDCINKAIKTGGFGAGKIENFAAEETQFPSASKSEISKALKLNKRHYYLIWNNKAMILYKLERYDEALDCINKAIKTEGFGVGKIENFAVDEKPFLNDSKSGISVFKLDKHKKIWVNKAKILMKIGEKEEALRYIDKTLKLDPDFEKAVKVKKELLKDH